MRANARSWLDSTPSQIPYETESRMVYTSPEQPAVFICILVNESVISSQKESGES